MSEADLSDEIAKRVIRNPKEQVTCRKVSNNHYRCNWWAAQDTGSYDNPSMSAMLVTTSRICRSRFLRVVKSGDQLSITDVSSGKQPQVLQQRTSADVVAPVG